MTILKYPWWVRLGIYGSNSRLRIAILTWIYIVIGAGILLMVAVSANQGNPPAHKDLPFWGILFLLGGIHAYLSRRWMDRHGDWAEIRRQWIEGCRIAVSFVIIISLLILYQFIKGWMSAT